MELLIVCAAFLLALAVMAVYFARTTWNSQRHQSEMTRLAITALLARDPATTPMAAALASPPEPSHSANHRLVRYAAPDEPGAPGPDEYDRNNAIEG